MNSLRLEAGSPVQYETNSWRVLKALDFETILLRSMSGSETVAAPISALKADVPTEPAPSALWADIPEKDWFVARKRYEYIKPLVRVEGQCTTREVGVRAAEVGLSTRTLRRYLRRYLQNRQLSALLPRRTQGGKGTGRLSRKVEDLIQDLIRKYYLKKQRPTKKDFAIRVITECKARKLPVPGINTIIRRLNSLPAQLVARRRLGGKAAAKLEAFPGTFDRAKYPLAVVAIDHTKLDAIAVDEEYCLPIGRPWITLVMDVFSRMVLGYYISLDPTGGLSAGLALAHAICKKDKWLAERGIEKPWPCWGVMQCIQADNALEFHGKMLERACREYSIDLMFRRPGEPHFGGHIERKIGTLLKQVHKLPGSTFGSVPERAEYDSEGNARLTLRDLDDLIGRWIVEIHHNTIHREIKTTPLKRWTEGFFGTELTSPLRSLPAPRDEAAEGRLKLDFMPYQERSVQRAGVEAFGFRYFAEELRPWIRSKLPGSAKSRQFVFVFDPRDISRLYFFDPEVKDYFVVPFADPSKSSISIWEARAANRKLKEEGKRSVDEAMLYEAIERLRREAAEKAATSKRHRRERERMAQHAKNRGYIEPEDPEESDAEDASDQQPVKPFEVEML